MLKKWFLPDPYGLPKNFNPDKRKLIDFAFQKIQPQPHSFADLGGIWGIDGAYTFYTIDRYDISHAFLVDTDITDVVNKKRNQYKNLNIIHGNFGKMDILEQIDKVDCIFLFDVLLHQVKPDWDEILKMYAPLTNSFVVYNQQFIKTEKTVRLLDLGLDEYFENVPHDRNHPTYKALVEKMYEMNPQHKRIWRDIHNVWQWGITNSDLLDKMDELGFSLKYHKNFGQFPHHKNFQNHAFIFQREDSPSDDIKET